MSSNHQLTVSQPEETFNNTTPTLFLVQDVELDTAATSIAQENNNIPQDSYHHNLSISNKTPNFPSSLKIKCETLLIGIGTALPWIVFVNAIDYFQIRFCSEEQPWMMRDFEAIFSFVCTAANLLTVAILLFLIPTSTANSVTTSTSSKKDKSTEEKNQENKFTSTTTSSNGIIPSFLISFITLLFNTLLVFLPSSSYSSPTFFFTISLLSLILFGICSSIINIQFYAFIMSLPQEIGLIPFSCGFSTGGFLISMISLSLLWMDPTQNEIYLNSHCTAAIPTTARVKLSQAACVEYEIDYFTFGYFLVPCFILGACVFAFLDLKCIIEIQKSAEANVNFSFLDLQSSAEADPDTNRKICIVESTNEMLHEPLLTNNESSSSSSMLNECNKYYSKLILLITSILFIFTTTFCIFPGVLGTMTSIQECTSTKRIFNELFTPTLFIIFNASEIIGKIFSSYIFSCSSIYGILTISFLRLIFFYVVFALPVFSDYISISLIFLLAISNGALSNLCFIHGNSITPTGMEEWTSSVLNFGLYFGLLLGSAISILYIDFLLYGV